MMKVNHAGAVNRVATRDKRLAVAKVSAALALSTMVLTLAGCAYDAPPQPRLPYRGPESTNPSYPSQPNCGPPPYAPGSACSPYAAPPSSSAPGADAYGRPYPPTDGYGRPYPTDAQGRPYAPPPPAYRESNPANGAPVPENGSATAH
ncbi:hypothetical protein UC34_17095 [Pandoraea vervacti]|uniref:Lipoprotein n=1 Tax=Pandoraea vervacti TaxID=656178 RepID=A0ABM5T069_9BURK|nr:hypothetical protein [Pandoraea vervacti]AJP58221.1 hypothetical protein UC34_17095 [Pandoraea vervacti]